MSKNIIYKLNEETNQAVKISNNFPVKENQQFDITMLYALSAFRADRPGSALSAQNAVGPVSALYGLGPFRPFLIGPVSALSALKAVGAVSVASVENAEGAGPVAFSLSGRGRRQHQRQPDASMQKVINLGRIRYITIRKLKLKMRDMDCLVFLSQVTTNTEASAQ